jgi:GNAT superfamily N-acetyltransferase
METPSEFRVTRLREVEIPELIRVKAQVYGLEPTESPEYYRWKFFDNPHRGELVPFWFLREGDRIVGGIGALPVRMRVEGREHRGEFACEMFVERGRQRAGLGTVLMDAYLADSPWPLMMNTSPSLSRFLAKRGFHDLSPGVAFRAYPLRLGALLASRLGPPWKSAAHLAGPVFELALGARRWLSGLRRDDGVDVEEQKVFGAWSDAIWEQAGADYPIVVIRDRAYLTWKYERHPLWKYRILLASKAGRPLGYATFRLREGPSGPTGVVQEIFAPRAASAVRRALLRAAVRSARAGGADAVKVLATDSAVVEDLRREGFLRVRSSPGFFVPRQAGLDGPGILDPRCWYLTGGDSDLDYR